MSKKVRKQKKRNTKKFRKNIVKRINNLTSYKFSWSKVPPYLIKLIFGEKKVQLDRSSKVRFITNYKTLPKEGYEVVQEYIRTNKVLTSGCHPNSVMVSCLYPMIKTIHGFVGVKLTSQEIDYWNLKKGIQSDKGLVSLNVEGYGTYYFDFGRKMKYFRHSWNEMDGLHFDLTKCLNPNITVWWNYYPTEIIDLSKDTQISIKDITKTITVFKNELQSEGERILNINQLRMVS